MTSKKTTRRALLSSAIALILCCSMLMGTTYAWFTDEVASMNNVITAGNLDVEVVNAKGDITAEGNQLFQGILWEPGVVAYETLTVRNVGTLALSYRMTLAFEALNYVQRGDVQYTLADVLQVAVVEGGFSGDRAAAEALEYQPIDSFTTFGELLAGQNSSETVSVVIYWEPGTSEVDNLFNVNNGVQTNNGAPLQINLGVNVFATQLEAESDSFDHLYDEQADRTINAGETVYIIDENVDKSYRNDGNLIVENSVLNADGFALHNYGEADLNGVEVNAGSPGEYALVTLTPDAVTNLEAVDVNTAGGGVAAMYGATVNFNSGTVDLNSPSTSGRYLFYAEGEGSKIVINHGDFDFNKTQNQKRAYIYASAGTTVIVNGGNFGKASSRSGYTAGILGEGTVIITGGTFKFDPTKWVAVGYEAVKNGDTWTVQALSQAEANQALDVAIANGETNIILGSGTYIIPDSAKGKTLTFIGNGETVVATQDDGSYEGCDYSLDGATVVFENITINTNSATYTGYARLNATYNNCTINGTYTLYGDSEFNNCTFNVVGDVYNIWTWGAPKATFNGCTFNSDGKALLLYGQANTVLTVNNCVFNDNGALTDLKAAIEIGNDYDKSYELIVNNTVVNGYEINDKGISTGTTLWANKNSMGTDKLNVIVDGVDVY